MIYITHLDLIIKNYYFNVIYIFFVILTCSNICFASAHKIVQEFNSNKEERYSRVPRLSDTRYSKGNGDLQAAKRD